MNNTDKYLYQKCLSEFGCELTKHEPSLGHTVYMLEGIAIYAVASHPTQRRWYDRWQFNLSQYRPKTDILILIAVDRDNQYYPYVIPSKLATKNRYEITSHPDKYKGRLARYLNNWQAILDIADKEVA